MIEEGTYQLLIEGRFNAIGDYSFRLLNLEATGINLDTDIEGTLDPGTSSAVFTFDGTAGQRLFIDGMGSQFGGSYVIYNSLNQFVSSQSLGFDRIVDLTLTGTHTLIIQGSTTNGPLDYELRIITPDITTAPLIIGENISSDFAEPGEIDKYTFNGTAGQRLYFDGFDRNSIANARLFSPSGNNVHIFGNSTASDSAPFSLIESGIYELRVESSSNVGDYNFRLLDFATVTDLPLDTIVEGTLETGRQTELFSFEGTADQRLFLDGLGTQFNGTYVIYSSGNRFVESQTFGFDRDITLPGDGTYFILVQGFNFNEESLDYSFRLITPNTSTIPLSLGETVNDSLEEPGETDIFSFTGTQGQRLFFDGLDNNAIANARLISPNGNPVSIFGTSTGADNGPFTLTETGVYQLRIEGSSNTGDYSFRLLNLAEAVPLAFDTTVEETLDPGRQVNIFQFDGVADQVLFLNNLDDSFNPSFRFYGSNNQFIGSGGGFDRDLVLPFTGSYFLIVQGSGNNPLDYQFQLETPEISTVALTLNSTISDSIDNPGDQIRYTFDGVAGQRLLFDGLDGSSFDVRLFSPSGDNVSIFGTRVDFDNGPFSLLETGVYELLLDGNGDATGQFNFRLLDLATATTIALGETLDQTLDPGRETDLYQIDLQAGQTIQIDDLGSSQFNGNYAVYGPSNQFIASQNPWFRPRIYRHWRRQVYVTGSKF